MFPARYKHYKFKKGSDTELELFETTTLRESFIQAGFDKNILLCGKVHSDFFPEAMLSTCTPPPPKILLSVTQSDVDMKVENFLTTMVD